MHVHTHAHAHTCTGRNTKVKTSAAVKITATQCVFLLSELTLGCLYTSQALEFCAGKSSWGRNRSHGKEDI